jgi:hypothetical protein
MMRVLPAFGVGGVMNRKMRLGCKEVLNDSWAGLKSAQVENGVSVPVHVPVGVGVGK